MKFLMCFFFELFKRFDLCVFSCLLLPLLQYPDISFWGVKGPYVLYVWVFTPFSSCCYFHRVPRSAGLWVAAWLLRPSSKHSRVQQPSEPRGILIPLADGEANTSLSFLLHVGSSGACKGGIMQPALSHPAPSENCKHCLAPNPKRPLLTV